MSALLSSVAYLILIATAVLSLCIGVAWVILMLVPMNVTVSPAWPIFIPMVSAVLAMRRANKWSHLLHLTRFVLTVLPFIAIALVMRPEQAELAIWASLMAGTAAVSFCLGYLLDFIEQRRTVRRAVNSPDRKTEAAS